MVEPVYHDGVLVYYRYNGYALWKFLGDEWKVYVENDMLSRPMVLYKARTLENAIAYVDGRM